MAGTALFDSLRQRATAGTLALTAIVLGTGGIGGAWLFELAGYLPCPQCLLQRQPYYWGLPAAVLALIVAQRAPTRAGLAALLLALVALGFAWGAFVGGRQAGAEWGFWSLAACDGGSQPALSGLAQFQAALATAKVVSCTEPALRIMGLSLAGLNALLSSFLCGLFLLSAWRLRSGSLPRFL